MTKSARRIAVFLAIGFLTLAGGFSASAEPTVIPPAVLLYKYVPEVFSDAYLLQRTQEQVDLDKMGHMSQKDSTSYIFLFSKEQVEGRVSSFAATELLPIYKDHLSGLAQQLPSRLNMSKILPLNTLVYADGFLRQKSTMEGDDVFLYYGTRLSEDVKLNLPPLGSREVINFFQLEGDVAVSGYPYSLTQSTPLQQTYLALDRVPTIPLIAMNPTDAERMWQNTGSVTVSFDIEIEGVEVTGDTGIVKASIMNATVSGPHGELIKRFDAADFPRGEDVWQAQKTAEKAERERIAAVRDKLKESDILGIRLGMTLDEAEKIIREKMDVGWVAESVEPSNTNRGPDPNSPYSEFRIFISAVGAQQIVLFSHRNLTDRVLGIAREVTAPAGATDEAMVKKLLEKYGQDPAIGGTYSTMVWAVDFGVLPENFANGGAPGRSYQAGSCLSGVGIGWELRLLNMLESPPQKPKDRQFRMPRYARNIDVKGGFAWGGVNNRQKTWDAALWRDCGPAVIANRGYGNARLILKVIIFDLAAYADIYLQWMESRKVESDEATISIPDL